MKRYGKQAVTEKTEPERKIPDEQNHCAAARQGCGIAGLIFMIFHVSFARR